MANTKVTSHVIANNAISASMIQSAAVTDAKLHSTLDLSGKTLTLPATAIPSASTATTQAASDNSTKIATTAYVTTAIGNLVDSAPGALDTLNELAAALGDDASFSSTVTTSLATKAPINNPTFTGSISHASDLTLDAGGDIVFDADGGDFRFKDNGTQQFIIDIDDSAGDVMLRTNASNKDMIFQGNVGGSNTTVLTLDMSEAGFATFNSGGSFGGTGALKIPAGTTGQRPTAATAQIRWNTTDGALEVYNGSAWTAVGTGTSNKVLDTFTGDGSNRTFTLSVTPANEDAIMVFIDGAYQEKADYVLTNNSLVLDTAPLANEKIAVHTTTAAVHDGTSAVNQQFTGDGSTTDFTLSQSPGSENNTQVYINGVYQQKTDYTVTGTTLTFDTAPTNGDIIEVNMFTVTTLGNTDTVTEGVSNLYHTTARARSAISVSGNAISYNSSTGVLTANFEEGPTFTNNAIVNGTLGVGTSVLNSWAAFDGRIRAGARGLYATTSASTQMGYNWYYDGAYKYIGADFANRYFQNGGNHVWETAASGSADGAITWSEKMRIDTNGNVGIGTASPNSYTNYTALTINGTTGGLLDLETNGTFVGEVFADSTSGMGLQSIGSRYIRFLTNGGERMRIDSGGNVGIGTGNSTPATNLHVYHPTSHAEIRAATSGSSASKVPAFSVNNTNAEWSMAIVGANDNHLHFRENTASYASRLVIATGGNVGIGTAAPAQALEVVKSGFAYVRTRSTTSGFTGFDIGQHSGGNIYLNNRDNTDIIFQTNNSPRMHVTAAGNLAVGNAISLGQLADGRSTLHMIGNNTAAVASNGAGINGLQISRTTGYGENLYLYLNSTNTGWSGLSYEGRLESFGNNALAIGSSQAIPIVFAAGGTERMRVNGNGKVGIGIDNPYSQFDIYTTSTAGYNAGSFLSAPTAGLKGPAGNGYYVGTRVTNASGNYEWFYGATQTSANEADFVFQGYDRGGGAYKELLRITDSGKLKLATNAGLKMFSGYFGAGTSTGSFNVQGYGGGCMKITAAFNHYGFISSYGCFKQAICSNGPGHGGTSMQVNDLGGEITSGNGGSWTFHRNSGDQASYKVTKNAGTYAGGGYYYIMFEGNMGVS